MSSTLSCTAAIGSCTEPNSIHSRRIRPVFARRVIGQIQASQIMMYWKHKDKQVNK